ncbi:MAG: hypothetical protein ACJ8F3_15490 [Xanthobacteraceae bacterium]
MPLASRVDPFGQLFADAARGLFMGNRGGRIHRNDRTLGTRRWASRQWICCRLEFKNRRREVWGNSYTELFFLDEATALAAGHRPCFECRRADANAFITACRLGAAPADISCAGALDRRLHRERLSGRGKRLHPMPMDGLPDGTFLVSPETPSSACVLRGDTLLAWTPAGYGGRRRRQSGMIVQVLTPPIVIAALAAGYKPVWHSSAD